MYKKIEIPKDYNTDVFWSKSKYSNKNKWNNIPCLEWIARLNNKGYGTITINKNSYYSHRVSWTLENGKIPKNLMVLHHCDNRKCINPNHLFLGTNEDNVRDMIEKGRQQNYSNMAKGNANGARKYPEKLARGEKNGSSKLKEYQVLEICRLNKETKISMMKLAKIYGVSDVTISKILKGETWKNVTNINGEKNESN